MSHGGDGGNNKQLVNAMSLFSLTNICFKNCVMKNDPSITLSESS